MINHHKAIKLYNIEQKSARVGPVYARASKTYTECNNAYLLVRADKGYKSMSFKEKSKEANVYDAL